MSEILKDTTTNKIGTGAGGLVLDPADTETVTISNGVVIPDGTRTEPAIRLSDDNNTGIYSPVNESIALTGNGEDVFRINGVAEAVNYANVTNSTTGADVVLVVDGTDANASLAISGKGTGTVKLNGLSYPTADGVAGQVMTTDGTGNLTFSTVTGGSGTTGTLASIDFGTITGSGDANKDAGSFV